MNKLFKSYLILWTVLFAVFQVIAFALVRLTGQTLFTPSFWCGYILIDLSLLGDLICGYFALKEENAHKAFYSISLLYTAYIGLVLTFVVGGLCMLLPFLPFWLGGVLCAVVLGINIAALVKNAAAIDIVEEVDHKVQGKTLFIRSLTADAELLLTLARSEEAKVQCHKVYEAIRYSDPMSDDSLAALENDISLRFARLREAVETDDPAQMKQLADDMLLLLKDRNKRVQLLKG